MDDVRHAGNALWWLAGPSAWLDVGRTLAADARAESGRLGCGRVAFLALLIYWRRRFRTRIEADRAADGPRQLLPLPADAGSHVLTVLVAVGLAGIDVVFRLAADSAAAASSDVCKALGIGLTETARVFLALELLRQTCSAGGLGESHFGWSAAAHESYCGRISAGSARRRCC